MMMRRCLWHGDIRLSSRGLSLLLYRQLQRRVTQLLVFQTTYLLRC